MSEKKDSWKSPGVILTGIGLVFGCLYFGVNLLWDRYKFNAEQHKKAVAALPERGSVLNRGRRAVEENPAREVGLWKAIYDNDGKGEWVKKMVFVTDDQGNPNWEIMNAPPPPYPPPPLVARKPN